MTMLTTVLGSDLNSAIILATYAHVGQVDKQGEPYIFHPMRVMMNLIDKSERLRIVAVLHDVLEDGPPEMESLLQVFDHDILHLVRTLTHPRHEPYMDYIERIGAWQDATVVKLADLTDNLDRLPGIKDHKTKERLGKKYFHAETYLWKRRMEHLTP